MTIKGESFDIMREKQELDIFLSRITGISLPDGVVQETPAVTGEVPVQLPGSNRNEAFNLVQEKEEVNSFLSGIAMIRLPDEIVREAVKEPQQAAVQKATVPAISADEVPPHKEQPSREPFNEEKGVAATVEQKGLKEAGGVESQILQTGEKPEEKVSRAAVAGAKESLPEVRRVREKKAVKEGHAKGLWGARLRLIGLFLVFIIITQAFLWLNPNVGHHTIEWMHTHIPLIDRFLGEEKSEQKIIVQAIEFIDVRQRLVPNELLGSLLIIEGAVVNQADFPVAKVRVMGELSDSQGRLLASRVSYCGNMLSDEALGGFREDDMRMRSSIVPQEDRIVPRGQMPFMIVFKRPQADVAKVTVKAVGAEKVSP